MSDPVTASSVDVTQTAFNRAFQVDVPFWSFLEQSEQSYRFRRFGIAMQGVAAMQPADTILKAFDWQALPQDAVVVDVGGGVGAVSLALAKSHSHLKIVIQDRPAVVEEGKTVWKRDFPQAIETGRVVFEEHDFFTPQPRKNASVFLLKQIMHDWSDNYAEKILLHLRKAATADTKLLLIDCIMPYACHDPTIDDKDAAPGSAPREAPEPLLPNYGAANEMEYTTDFTMLVFFNAQERTYLHLAKLLKQTGWKIARVVRDGVDGFFLPVEAIPV